MSPREVVNAAVSKGLDLIGVCDHNSAENVLAVKKAGSQNGLMVLGGMEVTSSEEAHILVFFDNDDDLLDFQGYIYRHLEGTNDERAFGMQVIADDEDGVSGCLRPAFDCSNVASGRGDCSSGSASEKRMSRGGRAHG